MVYANGDLHCLNTFHAPFSKRSPDERSDIRDSSRPACRYAHAGYEWLNDEEPAFDNQRVGRTSQA